MISFEAVTEKLVHFFGINLNNLSCEYWYAEIDDWYWHGGRSIYGWHQGYPFEDRIDRLVICVLKQTKKQQGIILIPPIHPPFNRFLGGSIPLTAMDLTGWNDPVASILQNFKLPQNSIPPRQGSSGCRFNLRFRVGGVTQGPLLIKGWTLDDEYDRLPSAVYKALDHLIHLYDHNEMYEFFGIDLYYLDIWKKMRMEKEGKRRKQGLE